MPIDRRTLLTGAVANASGIAVPRPPMASVLGAQRAHAGARSRLLLTGRPSWFAPGARRRRPPAARGSALR